LEEVLLTGGDIFSRKSEKEIEYPLVNLSSFLKLFLKISLAFWNTFIICKNQNPYNVAETEMMGLR
jgi:hypothetical protein